MGIFPDLMSMEIFVPYSGRMQNKTTASQGHWNRMAPAWWSTVIWVVISAVDFRIIECKGLGEVHPEVATNYGRLRGKQADVKGTEKWVNVFLGVPFARPPTGSLRFSSPQPPEPWDGIRDAANHPAVCPQDLNILKGVQKRWKEKHPPFQNSEDCLYLNIYTPAHSSKTSKLPVMVWIHGGNFVFGAASRYDGSAIAAYEDVVVVTIQYRLGLLGFFSTGDENARGNWAFLDQLAALQWIHENIGPFGGDPESVTLFGASAGSVSVSAHVLSPLSKGLFHRAILESGVAQLPTTFSSRPQLGAEIIARVLGCEMTTSAAMVQCLRQKSEQELILANITMHSIGPVLDGVFMPKTSEEILAGKEFSAVPLMVGVTNHEFGWNIRITSPLKGLREVGDRNTIYATLKTLLSFLSLVLQFTSLSTSTVPTCTMTPNQIMLKRIMRMKLASFSGGHFSLVTSACVVRNSCTAMPWTELEAGLLCSQCLDEATEEEKLLSRTIMKYWANFARNGNPNGEGLVEWPAYNTGEQYLELNLKQKVSSKLKEKKVAFWIKTVPEKINELRQKHTDL
ncbi:fatty acyl-CoA hydrolase precursor, medium chain-like isoform X2 [Rhineura floridana]|uniref:fatty acyl-CoA hydrolase precursor, medium chain-like isoform X2 n=1 Tax=Rhineura floridana TaxID=261503 RepID=UPI002AC80CE5|nr:fatty acyl-CoA hydrolase precursor, medium chain-like isoform X2 [Rhineura floridana]